MLTDAEREKFIAWLDAETEKAEAARHVFKIADPAASEGHRVQSIAFRIVALRLARSIGMEMVNNPSLERSPHTGAP